MRALHLIKVIHLLVLLFFSCLSQAETLAAKRQIVACANESLLGEMRSYETSKDQKGVTKLMTSGQCILISTGESFTIIRPGILTATIGYKDGKFFTRADAIR
jgi:hypothetical protein